MKQSVAALSSMIILSATIAGCVQKVPKDEGASAGASTPMAGAGTPEPAGAPTTAAPEPTTAAPDPKLHNGRLPVGTADAPPSGMGSAPSGEPSAPAGAAKALAKAVTDAEAAYKKNPNDAKAKSKYAEALYQQGYAIMMDNALPPRQKYRPALLLFNHALSVDPTHKAASANKQTIEEIYKQMGMPIPK